MTFVQRGVSERDVGWPQERRGWLAVAARLRQRVTFRLLPAGSGRWSTILLILLCSVLASAGCDGGIREERGVGPPQASAYKPARFNMPNVISIGLTECAIGRALSEGEISTGCQYQGVPARWDRTWDRTWGRSHPNDRLTLVALEDGRYLGLAFCQGGPVQQIESSEFDCR